MKRIGIALVVMATLGLMFVAAPSASAKKCGYPPCPPPTAEQGNDHPTPGGNDDLSGSHWCPGSTVQIFLDGKFVATAQVDSSGHFNYSLAIPPNISDGHHTVTITGLDSTCDNKVSRVLGFTISRGSAGGGNLPFTGSNISVGILLLLALMIIGATSLVAGRRRKAAPSPAPEK